MKLGTHLGGINSRILWEIVLVRLELVTVLNGFTLNWTFTYSQTIAVMGLVMFTLISNIQSYRGISYKIVFVD